MFKNSHLFEINSEYMCDVIYKSLYMCFGTRKVQMCAYAQQDNSVSYTSAW